MTITYQHSVASGTFNGFSKLLLKWRGSLYKLVYKELVVFTLGYMFVRVIYKKALNDEQKLIFERLSIYCARYIEMIPVSFVLGFYVTFVVQRWWTQFTSIPFPDCLMNTVIVYVDGVDERSTWIRRNLMRYWNLSFVLMMITISSAVQRRFPTMQHLVRAGFMTEEELQIYSEIEIVANKAWFPTNWFLALLNKAKEEGLTKDSILLQYVIEELNDFRIKLKLLWCHFWVTLPLVYTQVVTWALFCYFLVSAIGRQYLDPEKGYVGHEIDFEIPFFTIMQFLFYMGWLKVAEQLINPFGEDDDDIECNWLIDRHIQVSYVGVDTLITRNPKFSQHDSDDSYNGDHPKGRANRSNLSGAGTRSKNSARNRKTKDNGSLLDLCCKICHRVCGCICKNKIQKIPKTLGSRVRLLSEDDLARLNGGSWNFSPSAEHGIEILEDTTTRSQCNYSKDSRADSLPAANFHHKFAYSNPVAEGDEFSNHQHNNAPDSSAQCYQPLSSKDAVLQNSASGTQGGEKLGNKGTEKPEDVGALPVVDVEQHYFNSDVMPVVQRF